VTSRRDSTVPQDPTHLPPVRELIRIQAAVLFRHNSEGRLVSVNEPDGARAPRFFLGRTAQGSEWRFRDDLSEVVCRELESLCASEPLGEEYLVAPHGSTAYEQALAQEAPVQRVWAGPAYRFPAELPAASGTVVVKHTNAEILLPQLAPWLDDVALGRLIVARVHEGVAVSVCASVRENDVAHEAGVETVAELRGRGFAMQAVAGWAAAIRAMGRIPLYSTSWQNTASQALASKLGLVRYGTDLHIT
jgi:RimJ/RimL family protein N-acetyltransferase